MFERLLGLAPPIARRFEHLTSSPIQVEVLRLIHATMPPEAVTAYPDRYEAAVVLTNRSRDHVVLKGAALVVNGQELTHESEMHIESIQLEPGQFRRLDILFPASPTPRPRQSGTFKLVMRPGSGRSAVAKGEFPKKE